MLSRRNNLLALLAVLVLLAVAAGVEAAEIDTDIVFSNGSTFVDYKCTLTNLGTKLIDANFTITNSAGILEKNQAINNISPGVTASSVVFGDDAGGVWCRVSGNFSKSTARVTLQLIDTGSGITQVIVPGK